MGKRIFIFVTLALLTMSLGLFAHAASYPESEHPYANNTDQTWTYTHPKTVKYLKIVFSGDTEFESGYDTLTLTDANGVATKFYGTQLRGTTIYLEGNSFTLHLVSDSMFNDYGFAIASITEATEAEFSRPRYYLDNGQITGYTGKVDTLKIPSTVDGVTVSGIGRSAFAKHTELVKVTIPTTVSYIDRYAFEYCAELESINIPDAVRFIGSSVFYHCDSLKSVAISDKSVLEIIGDYAFSSCQALERITIPAGVTELGNSVFHGCSSLQAIDIKAKAIALGEYTFYLCPLLAGIDAPITSLGKDALKTGGPLTHVAFDDNMSALDDETLEDLKACSFLIITVSKSSPVYPQLKANDICYVVRETGETNQGNLPTDTVRGMVEHICRTVIKSGMSDYEKALALHDWLVENAEYDYSFSYSGYFAEGVLLYGKGVCNSYTLAYKALLDYVGIENDVEDGYNHTWNMIKLDGEWYHVDVTWDDQGSSSDYRYFGISNYALQYERSHECYNKRHIATAYKYNYRYRNGYLDSLLSALREGVKTSFAEGKGSFDVTMPGDSYITIEGERWYSNYASDIDRRTAMLIVNSETFSIGNRTVRVSLDSDINNQVAVGSIVKDSAAFTLPAKLKTIDEEAFIGLPVKTVKIPSGVKTIKSKAFANCSKLYQVEIPASVTSIADNAFNGCGDLIVFGKAGSAAETFARKKGYIFVEE